MRTSPSWGRWVFLIDDLSLDGCNGRLSTVIYAQLIENMDDMTFHRVGADAESGGDSGIGTSFGQQMQDLGFPVGKAMVFRSRSSLFLMPPFWGQGIPGLRLCSLQRRHRPDEHLVCGIHVDHNFVGDIDDHYQGRHDLFSPAINRKGADFTVFAAAVRKVFVFLRDLPAAAFLDGRYRAIAAGTGLLAFHSIAYLARDALRLGPIEPGHLAVKP